MENKDKAEESNEDKAEESNEDKAQESNEDKAQESYEDKAQESNETKISVKLIHKKHDKLPDINEKCKLFHENKAVYGSESKFVDSDDYYPLTGNKATFNQHYNRWLKEIKNPRTERNKRKQSRSKNRRSCILDDTLIPRLKQYITNLMKEGQKKSDLIKEKSIKEIAMKIHQELKNEKRIGGNFTACQTWCGKVRQKCKTEIKDNEDYQKDNKMAISQATETSKTKTSSESIVVTLSDILKQTNANEMSVEKTTGSMIGAASIRATTTETDKRESSTLAASTTPAARTTKEDLEES